MTDTFEIIGELLDLCLMKGIKREQDIFGEVDSVLVKFNFPKDKLSGETAMTGKQNGFVSLMHKSVPHEVITHHCIIHQEQLCAKILEMKCDCDGKGCFCSQFNYV